MIVHLGDGLADATRPQGRPVLVFTHHQLVWTASSGRSIFLHVTKAAEGARDSWSHVIPQWMFKPNSGAVSD